MVVLNELNKNKFEVSHVEGGTQNELAVSRHCRSV
jgi:hypothetical protein